MKLEIIKIVLLYILVLLISVNLYGTTYYVSSSQGKDRYKGTTTNKPWKTLSKVNRSQLLPGDSVLFKRGDVWREQLAPTVSGIAYKVIYFGAYGKGDKPLFLGSISKSNLSDWKSERNNIWKTKLWGIKDVGNIILNFKADMVTKKAAKEVLQNGNDFFSKKNKLYFKLGKNPASAYQNIEIAITKDIIKLISLNYLTIENLAIKYGGGHGVFCNNSSYITIRSCDISYIGGGFLNPNERYGNGIEFWETNNNCLVENCFINQIYDSGLTNQGRGNNSFQEDLTYKGNTISNCGLSSFEYFNRSSAATTKNIIFENNISKNAGFGWAPERPNNYGGYHILLGRNSGQTNGIFIINNEFNNSKQSEIVCYVDGIWNGFESLNLENNIYHEISKEKYLFRMFVVGKGWENYKFKEKDLYIRNINKDKTSIFR